MSCSGRLLRATPARDQERAADARVQKQVAPAHDQERGLVIGVGGRRISRTAGDVTRRLGRPARVAATRPADEVLWGIVRRREHSDIDDPSAHAGRVQHAFLLGDDSKALCGFRPRRIATTADDGPVLAVPSPRYNPMCPRCSAVVSQPTGRVLLPRLEARMPVAISVEERAEPEPIAIELPAPIALAAHSATDLDSWMPQPIVAQPAAPTSATVALVPYDARMTPSVVTVPLPAKHARPRSRRRSVRKGGIVTAMPGEASVMIEVPALADGASVVAHVADEIIGARVSAVAIVGNTTVAIELDSPVTSATDVAWFIVSPVRRG